MRGRCFFYIKYLTLATMGLLEQPQLLGRGAQCTPLLAMHGPLVYPKAPIKKYVTGLGVEGSSKIVTNSDNGRRGANEKIV